MRRIYLLFVLLFSGTYCVAQAENPFKEYEYFQQYTGLFALDEHPSVLADTNLIAIWKVEEEEDKHNYFVVERGSINEYVFTYMNRGGTNRTYENFTAFMSKIGNVLFLNVGLYNYDTRKPEFFYLKVTDIDNSGWRATLSLVTDTTLKKLTSREAVRERIAQNLNNPKFYRQSVHFDKILPLLYCK